ncbi:MAG TPA: diguanylate cyclase [Caldimonas sp.]|jgi:diguanylate cyclase (GGDEF)-like protein/PAS domain S-box-containing protein
MPTFRTVFSLRSLKVRLALAGAMLILASVAMTVIFVLHEVGRSSEQIVLDAQEDDARRVAATVSHRLVVLQRALRSVALLLPAATLADPAKVSEFMQGQPVLATLFSGLFVIGLDGKMLLVQDERGARDPHTSVADRDYFRDTVREQRPMIARIASSRVSGEPIVILTMPVFASDGRVAGVLGGSLRLLSGSLLDDLTQGSDGHRTAIVTIVVDAKGQILAHPQREWVLRDGGAEPHIAAALVDWRSRGSPVEPAGYAVRAGDHEVGIAGVPDADWLVLRAARVDDLLAGVVEGEKRARWVAFGVAVVGGVLTLLITFWFLRPLVHLKQRALQLIVEDADVEAGWPDLGGELGELSKVLQHVMRERQASQAAGQELLAKMRAVMAKAPVGIAFTRNRRFELVSDEFNRLLGYEGSGLEGEAARVIYASDEFYQGLGTRVGASFGMGRVFSEEIEFVRRDGSRFWGQLLGAPVSPHDAGAGTIWTLGDISEERRKRNALSWAATHDALTNIANRQEFESQLADHLADRRRREVACMLYVDLDGFKGVNDAAGHAAGDQLLRDIAALLMARIRSIDLAARLGGDEFGVLLRSCALPTALGVAEQIRSRIDAHSLHWQGSDFRVGVSIGVVQIEDSFVDVASVIAAADAACYAAKHAGRNAVRSGGPGLRLVHDGSS